MVWSARLDLEMSFLENPVVLAATGLVAGSAVGYWLWRWKGRTLRAALALKQQAALEDARRQAEALSRETRLQANEEALKIRQETESSFTRRRQELSDAEKRLVERECLIN